MAARSQRPYDAGASVGKGVRVMRLLALVSCLIVATLLPARVGIAQARSHPTTRDSQPTDVRRRVLLASLSAYSFDTRQEAQEKLMSMRGESVEAGLVRAVATAVDPDARR